MEQVRYRADGSVWQELLLKHRHRKKVGPSFACFRADKARAADYHFLTVYFIWLRQSPEVGAALTAVQAAVFLAACIVQSK